MSDHPAYHEVTFEKGVLESSEASMLPLGFASELTNWMPEPLGNLRCRIGWKNVVTAGAPATRSTRGIGFYSAQQSFQTPMRVQYAAGTPGTGANASASATWPAATTAGNLLILAVVGREGTNDADDVTLTATGWTLAVRQNMADPENAFAAIYYKANANSESGVVTVTSNIGGAGSHASLNVAIAEYSGILAALPLDVSAGNDGSGGAPDATATSGTTGATAQSDELVISVLGAYGGSTTFSSPSNNYTEVTEFSTGGANGSSGALFQKVATATGAQSMTATMSASVVDVGVIAAFKAAAVTGDTTRGYLVAANKDSATQYTLYQILVSQLLTGSWTSIESQTVTATGAPVAMASGLGQFIYTHHGFSTPRRWAGGSAAEVAGGPPGRAIAFHKNRFFIGGTTAAPSRVWFSQLADYTKYWDDGAGQTSLSDSTNYIDVGKDDGETIEDISVFADGLLIAKRTSLWFLSGDGPDNFQLERIASGTGYPGRCICPTPYGAVVAGEDAVWLVSGGAELISKPVEESYAPSGDYVSTAYADGQVHIVDSGTGTDKVFNITTGTWHTESVNSSTEEPAFVFSRLNRLYMGPQAATTGSLVSYRDFPQDRGRDANTSMVFTLSTPEMVLVTPEQRVTPRNMHYQIRQHAGDSNDTGITVTPYYNGAAGTAHTISPQASAGVFATTKSVGHDTSGKGVTTFKLTFSQTVPSDEEALMDIEAVVLEADIEERPHY